MSEQQAITVYRTSDGYKCPKDACSAAYASLQSLKYHCIHHHLGMRIQGRIQPTTIEQKKERKRKYNNTYKEKHTKRHKPRMQRDLFDSEDADTRGVFGASDPLVVYRQSLIPNAGNGIFAMVDLREGDVATWYAGDVSSTRAEDPEYTISLGDIYLNGIRTPVAQEGLGSFINRQDSATGKRKNCEFVQYHIGSHPIYIEITKDIKAGEELYTTYGRGYRIKK